MSKNGKKAIYIDSNNYSERIDYENFSDNESLTPTPDPIRYYGGFIWTTKKNKLTPADDNGIFSINFLNDETILLKADQKKFLETFFENGLLKKKFNKKTWQDFIETILPNKSQVFEDTFIHYSEPINVSEEKNIPDTSVAFLNKEFVYNFLSTKFESLVSDQLFDVSTLPSLFNLLNDKKLDTKTSDENLIVSLGGFIPEENTAPLYTAVETTDSVKSYFDKYADTYQLPEVSPVIKQLTNNNKFLTLQKEKLDISNKLNNGYVPFPFFTKIQFSNPASGRGTFISALSQMGNLDSELQQFIVNQYNITEKNFIYEKLDSKAEEVQIQKLDIKNWLNVYLTNNQLPNRENLYNTSNIVRYSSLFDYIKNNLKPKIRKFSNFLKEPCYQETLLLKIEKRQFNYNKTNDSISTTYIIPNETEIIKYFDTQIKYGTDYYYTISAYIIVVGNKYSYQEYYKDDKNLEKLVDIAEGVYKINIKNDPTYMIYEVPFVKFTGAVHEKPFSRPSVKFYQNDDKIIFNLLENSISSFEKFEIIENNDFKLFEQIRLSQDNDQEDVIQTAQGMSQQTILQIYRTADYPRSYLDFQNKLYKTIILENNNKSFIDSLLFNTKYYFTFRTLNQHNVPSNVSDIYEIQLINEDGYVYLETNKIDLNMPIPKDISKGMKRYLLIRPSIIQTQPKYDDEVVNIQNVSLGPSGENVWKKDFILTIRSKKSNRVLKFNLKPQYTRKNK